jgi:hypothetical protein
LQLAHMTRRQKTTISDNKAFFVFLMAPSVLPMALPAMPPGARRPCPGKSSVHSFRRTGELLYTRVLSFESLFAIIYSISENFTTNHTNGTNFLFVIASVRVVCVVRGYYFSKVNVYRDVASCGRDVLRTPWSLRCAQTAGIGRFPGALRGCPPLRG